MVYALKMQRLTTRKPPKDRFLTCQIHPSSEEKEGYAGCLFSLIEIDDNNYSSSQIGHSITNTTAREYFRQNNENASENFELALKKTNELLANYTQEGQTDWIGNLHGIIALIYKDEIYLTCIGKSNALLIREGKISSIYQETSTAEDIHPLCTFSNITSGQLEISDVIVLASKNIFSIFPKKELKELIEINSLEDASIEIAQTLSDEKLTDTNIILIETTTKENIANEPLSNIPETIFIDETNESILSKTRYFFKKKIAPKSSAISSSLSSGANKTSNWLKEKGLPHSHKSFKALNHAIKKTGEFAYSTSQRAYAKITKKNITYQSDKSSPIIQPNIKINRYNKFPKIKFSKIPLYPALILIFIAILIFSITIKIKHSTKTVNKPTQTSNSNLSSLQAKFDLTKNAKLNESIILLQEIITDLSNKKLSNYEKVLLDKSQKKYNTLTKTTTINIPSKKITPKDNTEKIFVLNNQIYTFTKKGEIYKNPIGANKLDLLTKLPTNSGDIISVSPPSSENTFFINTASQKVFEFQPTNNQIKLITAKENWPNSKSISTYSTNLYLLDLQNQIWKYSRISDGKYSSGQAYVSPKNLTNLAGLKNIAIDGIIYSIGETGKLSKIQKSQVTSIDYQKFPSPSLIPTHPSGLYTSPNLDNFFIVARDKIVITDKTGNYIKQLALSDQSEIKDIFVQPILKKIWILSGQSLFSTDY